MTEPFCWQDDENGKLSSRVTELEEERARLQKTGNIQQTLLEKQRALAEEAGRRSEALQTQVAGLQKVCPEGHSKRSLCQPHRPLQPSSLTLALLAGGGGVEEGPETSSRKPQLGGGPPEPRPGGGGAAEGPAEQHEAAEQGERVQEEPGGADQR